MEDYGALWWVLLAGGVGLVFGAGVTWIPLVFEGRRPSNLGKDSVRLREVLRQWELFVLTRRETVREVKRFANRARFVMAIADLGEEDEQVGPPRVGDPLLGQNSDERMRAFIGFVALEQCGVLGGETDEFDFEKWRREQEHAQQEQQKQNGAWPEGWIAEVKAEQWEEYTRVVG